MILGLVGYEPSTLPLRCIESVDNSSLQFRCDEKMLSVASAEKKSLETSTRFHFLLSIRLVAQSFFTLVQVQSFRWLIDGLSGIYNIRLKQFLCTSDHTRNLKFKILLIKC